MKAYELEEKIMHAWQVEQDIETVLRLLDTKYTEDQLMNMLIGIKELVNMRFTILFDSYEQFLKEMWKNDASRTDRIQTDEDGFPKVF